MPKIMLYIAALALLGFVLSSQFRSPETREPFIEACLSGGSGTQKQCRCLADYVHERLTQDEIRAVMENRVAGKLFQDKVANVVRSGANACR